MKINLAIAIIASLLGLGLGHKLFNKPPETKIVTKDVVHTETVIKEHKSPDGSVDKVVTIFSDKFETKDITQIAPKSHNDTKYLLGLTKQTDSISLVMGKRVLGNMFITGYVNTNKQAGIGLQLEF